MRPASDPNSSSNGEVEQRLPVIQEDAWITKREIETDRVRVRTGVEHEDVLVREMLKREHVDVSRVPIGREVASLPPIREEKDVTVIPIVEERLVVEKRLFLVEEVHVRRRTETEDVAIPATLRRTTIEIERDGPSERNQDFTTN